jgi:hypothetical protein
LTFRSLDGEDGEMINSYSPDRGARVLKLTEIAYSLEPAPEGNGNLLKKHSLEGTLRVLARNVGSLRFEYLDAVGRPLSNDTLERTDLLSTVRVTMTFSIGPNPNDERTLATAVTLDTQSASIDFAEPGYGIRLTQYFYPIAGPAGVAMRDFMDWGIILSSGNRDTQDRSYLYTFLAEKRFLEARAENVTWLAEVRDPVAMTFAPEKSVLAGSLFVAASGLRIGHLARVHPDEFGVLSSTSRIEVLEGTNALAQIGGIAFGLDGTLYITSREKGAIFRYRFDAAGKASGPETVTKVDGSPRTMVLGADGALYFILDKANASFLWKLPFDEVDEPQEPVLVGTLPGEALSLSADPFSGSLFVLSRERLGDMVVFELASAWLSDPSTSPIRVFSLEDFAEETMDGRSQDRETEERRAASTLLSVQLPATLLPDQLDFLAFDNLGLLYLGSREKDLVLKFDLDRVGSSRHMVHVAAVTLGGTAREADSEAARLQAWRKNRVGN